MIYRGGGFRLNAMRITFDFYRRRRPRLYLAVGPVSEQTGPVGASLFEHWTALVAALRSHDAAAIITAVRDVLNHLLGDEAHPVVMGAAAGGPVAKIDWQKWIGLITKILPLIFA